MRTISLLVTCAATVLSQDANAQFGNPHSLGGSVASPDAISSSAAVDLNDDGLMDYAFALEGGGGVIVFGPDMYRSKVAFAETYLSLAGVVVGAAGGSGDAFLATGPAGLSRITYDAASGQIQTEVLDSTDEWGCFRDLCEAA